MSFLRALLFLLLFAVPANAATPPRWIHEVSDLPVNPHVTWGHLPNGMRYALAEHPRPRGRITLRLFVAAGSLMEEDDQLGVAHMVEHLAFEGSENLQPEEMLETLERLGIESGPDANAFTSYEWTNYHVNDLAADEESVTRALRLLREICDRLTLRPEAVAEVHRSVLSEARLKEAEGDDNAMAKLEALFPGSLLVRRPPLGTPESIAAVPRQRIADFYRRWYVPSRITLVVAGDLDRQALEAQVREIFGSFTGEEAENPALGRFQRPVLDARVFPDPAEPTSVALLAVAGRPPGDSVARREEELRVQVMRQALLRRMKELAGEDRAPFSAVSLRSKLVLAAEVYELRLETTRGRWRDTLAVAEKELRRSFAHPLDDLALTTELVKALIDEGEHRDVTSRTLADNIVFSVAYGRVAMHPINRFELVEQLLPGVDAREALDAWRKLWQGGPLVVVAGDVAPETRGDDVLAVWKKSSGEPLPAARTAEEEMAEAVAQPSLLPPLGEPTDVVERRYVKEADVTQVRFGNNVRLNLKPTRFAEEEVAVLIAIDGGVVTAPPDQPGLWQMAQQTLLHGGLEEHSFADVRRRHPLAGRLAFSVSDENFLIRATVRFDQLGDYLHAAAAYLTAPGLRPETRAYFEQEMERHYKGFNHTPEGIFQSRVRRLIHGGDPRFGFPTLEVMKSRTFEELRTWLAEPLRTAYMEVSLAGSFEVDAAIREVARTLGSLPPRTRELTADHPGRKVTFPSKRGLVTVPYDADEDYAWAAVAWPTTDRQHEDSLRLTFLGKVLHGRLETRLLRQMGTSRIAVASHWTGDSFPDFGYLLAVADGPSVKAVELTELLREMAVELREGGVTEDEWVRVREPALAKMAADRLSNKSWVENWLSDSQSHPRRLENSWRMPAAVQAITREEVDAAARKYLGSDPLRVVIVPRREPR